MPTLSYAQVAQICYNAGFRDTGLVTAIAVAKAESGFNTTNRSKNTDSRKTTDRGLFQFNSYWHSEISDACADDPKCSAEKAYFITGGGRNWTPWSAYKNASYLQYVVPARSAAKQITSVTETADPDRDSVIPAGTMQAIRSSCALEFQYDQEGYQRCLSERIAYIQEQITKNGTDGATNTACAACGFKDIPSCFYCAEQYIFQVFSWAGINLALLGVLFIGIYLLFKDEIDPQLKKAKDAAIDVAKVAAIA